MVAISRRLGGVRVSDTTVSVAVYSLGVASMFAIDLIVAASSTASEAASWATLKSVVFVAAPLVLLGIDHALVRSPNLTRAASPLIAIHIPVLSTIVGVVAAHMFGVEPLGIALSTVALAVSSLCFGLYRARSQLARAQAVQQLWKVVALLLLLWQAARGGQTAPGTSWIVFGVAASLGLAAVTGGLRPLFRPTDIASVDDSVRAAYRSGLTFAGMIVILNLTLFGDQLILNVIGEAEESAKLFSHAAVLLPPIVFANGYLNFWLGSFARRDPAGFAAMRQRLRFRFPALASALGLTSFCLAWLALDVAGLGEFRFEPSLAALLAGVGVLRTLFFPPSAFGAVWATGTQLRAFAVNNVIGLVSHLLIAAVLLAAGVSPALAVVLGSAGNWAVRLRGARRLEARAVDAQSAALLA